VIELVIMAGQSFRLSWCLSIQLITRSNSYVLLWLQELKGRCAIPLCRLVRRFVWQIGCDVGQRFRKWV